MKVCSIKLAAAALLLSAMVPAAAFDFGGMVNDITKYSGNDISELSLDQKNAINVWIRTPFNNAGTTYLAAEGLFQYEYIASTDTNSLIADCDLLKFVNVSKFNKNTSLTISAGRFAISDASAIVFSQTCDGLLAQLKLKRISLSAYGGYTGLLNAKSITILNAADASYKYDSEMLYPLAAPYAVASATLAAPYLFANQTIGAQFYSFFATSDNTADYNRLYGTITCNGPLASNIFYLLTSTFGTADLCSSFSNLSQIQLNYYSSFKSMAITVNGIYASGKNGPFTSFVGFTSNTATYALTQPEYSELIKAGLSASIKPITSVYILAGADCIFAVPNDEITYTGTQWYSTAQWQIFTDMQMSISAQQYFGTDDATNKTSITAKAVISF